MKSSNCLCLSHVLFLSWCVCVCVCSNSGCSPRTDPDAPDFESSLGPVPPPGPPIPPSSDILTLPLCPLLHHLHTGDVLHHPLPHPHHSLSLQRTIIFSRCHTLPTPLPHRPPARPLPAQAPPLLSLSLPDSSCLDTLGDPITGFAV